MIVIVDYGVGNIGSIVSMLNKIGAPTTVSCDNTVIEKASKLILPGVGAFDKAMHELTQRQLIPTLNQAVLHDKKPILGICLGAQLLGKTSEEGQLPGLGWLDMDVKKLQTKGLRVPHMGWNTVTPTKDSILFKKSTPDEIRFYFVHSYYMHCQNNNDILATCYYGQEFTCAVNKDNVFGVQFHPEKSHRFGFNLLKSFCDA
jgi:glutamine amidotransferase